MWCSESFCFLLQAKHSLLDISFPEEESSDEEYEPQDEGSSEEEEGEGEEEGEEKMKEEEGNEKVEGEGKDITGRCERAEGEGEPCALKQRRKTPPGK